MFRRGDRRDKADSTNEMKADTLDEELVEGEEFDDNELVEDQPEDMTADLESQAADYLAGNDVWMYGPNAEAVLEILDRLEELVPAEARPLAEAWLSIPKSDREHARKAARKIAEDDLDVGRHLQLVREAVGTWIAVTGPFPEFVNAEPDWSRICTQAGEAALDAATAVILEGKVEEIHFESLFEPWSETMAQLDSAAETARIEGASAEEADLEEEDGDEVDEVDEGAAAEFGPNSDEVTDFLTRLWLLTPEQVGRLVSGWQDADRQELKVAHEGLRALVDEDPEWRDQVRHAQDKLAPWLNAGRIQDTAGFLGQAGQGESRKMAGPALADAIAALVLADLLDRRHAVTLYGPWFNLMGAPKLPAEDDATEEPTPKAKAMNAGNVERPQTDAGEASVWSAPAGNGTRKTKSTGAAATSTSAGTAPKVKAKGGAQKPKSGDTRTTRK